MIEIIIAGHGRFAGGIKSGVEMIFGPVDALDTVEFLPGETKTELDAKMAEAIKRHDTAKGIIVFCDLLQGSPFQSAASYVQGDSKIRVVYGANLAMVIECLTAAMSGSELEVDSLASRVVDTGRSLAGVFSAPSQMDEDVSEDW